MLLTLAQIASHATRFANLPTAPLSVVSEYVNVAYGMLVHTAGVQLSAQETTAYASTSTGTDNARLAMPTDFDRALGLKIGVPNSWSTATSRTTEWRGLDKLPAPQFDTVWVQSDTSGVPEVYADYATWFELRPSPDSMYSIELRYQRKASEMTASTATPALDEQWHWALALKASELLVATFSNDSIAEIVARRRYEGYVRDLRLDQGKKRADQRGMYFTYARRRP